jgi:hypothetical protein
MAKDAKSLNNVLHSSRKNFSDEDKQEVFKRVLDKDNVKGLLPSLLGMLETLNNSCAFLKA